MADTTPQRCNIGAQQRRRRYMVGIPLLIVGVLGSFWTKSFLWQIIAFFGFLGWFQGQRGICVWLAAGGAEDQDDGKRLLEDPDLAEYFQKQSRRVYWKAAGATLILMLIARGSFILMGR